MRTFHPHRPTALAILCLAAAAASGCATAGSAGKAPDIVWPYPPDKPRIKYVRSFQSEDDLQSGGLTKALRILVPASPDTVVAQPTGLAVTRDGHVLYVACANVSRILRVDRVKGTMEMFATEEGKRPLAPFGVALDGEENLYTTDMVNHAVWVYAPGGRFLRRIPVGDKPTGIAIDARRQLLYVVVGSTPKTDHRIEVYPTAGGQKLRTIGTRGPGPGQFNFPTNLAVAPDGNVAVVDMLNFRVQVFDPEGGLVSMFGQIGAGEPGSFDKAKGIAVDTYGNIYVSDSQQGSVQIFNSKYQVLMSFAGRALAPGFLLSPTAIAIDGQNAIFVADYAAGIVSEYKLLDASTDEAPAAAPGQPAGNTATSPK